MSTPHPPSRRQPFRFRHPAQVAVAAFATVILVGTLLLMLPAARAGPGSAPPLVALFTSTSAVCVTGLIVVDTPTYWSTFGQVVILGLIQIGGFGIMTLASLLALFAWRGLGLRSKLVAQSERKGLSLGDLRRVIVGVALFSFTFELVAAGLITFRMWSEYGHAPGRALYLGVFHAISGFNNAGFALFSDSLQGFVTDVWMNLTVGVAIMLGAIGFPVLLELWETRLRPKNWSLHTKLTLGMTLILLVAGMAATAAFEWSNPATLGELSTAEKMLPSFFHSTSRTAGFATLDVGAMSEASWLSTTVLMFIGGGSASAAGGIKVTTFIVLGFMIWAEVRGEPTVTALSRRIPVGIQRQALSVALIAVGVVVLSTLALIATGHFDLSRSLFEATSAFGTVGFSTGITPDLRSPSQLLLVVLMFAGRIGPITLATALALRQTERRYRYPEERPIIG
jgi:trk system potassium uptake protein